MLQDRLEWSINNESIQRKLFQETDLTFARALAVAQGAETAVKNLKEMQAPRQESTSSSSSTTGVTVKSEPVHKVAGKKVSTKEGGARVTCHCCGNPGHLAPVCRFRESVCHKCKKKGHLARVCRSKAQT